MTAVRGRDPWQGGCKQTDLAACLSAQSCVHCLQQRAGPADLRAETDLAWAWAWAWALGSLCD